MKTSGSARVELVGRQLVLYSGSVLAALTAYTGYGLESQR